MPTQPNPKTEEVLRLIALERETHQDRFGMEHDIQKNANDWIATVASHLTESSARNGIPPSREEFERSLIKSAAIIVAALEHVELMHNKKKLT